MQSNRYPAQVFYSDEDEGFIAIAPDLPGCSAFGETQEEALTELQTAIDVWREAAVKAGNPVPAPSKQHAEPLPSGKVLVRMPRSLHQQLIDRASYEATSLNQLVVMMLSSALTARTLVVAGPHLVSQGFYQGSFQSHGGSGITSGITILTHPGTSRITTRALLNLGGQLTWSIDRDEAHVHG